MSADERELYFDEEGGAGGGGGGRSGGFTARDALYIVFRHKFKMLFFFVFVLTSGVGGLLFLPDHFMSEAQVLIKGGRNPLTKDSEISVPMVEAQVFDELALMKGRILAEKVVAELGAERILTQKPRRHALAQWALARLGGGGGGGARAGADLPSSEEMRRRAVRWVMGNLELKQTRDGSNVIVAKLAALDPALAQDALGALMRFYRERHVDVYKPEVSTEFFAAETSRTLARLTEKQRELDVFRREHNIVSLESQKSQLLDMQRDLKTRLSDARAALSASKAKIGAYEGMLRELDAAALAAAPAGAAAAGVKRRPRVPAAPNPLVLELKRRLMELDVKKGEISLRYPETSREYQDVMSEIAVVEKNLLAELGLSEFGDGDGGEGYDALAPGGVGSAAFQSAAAAAEADEAARRKLEMDLATARAELTSQQAGEAALRGDLPALEEDLMVFQGLESDLRARESEVSVLRATSERMRSDLDRSRLAEALDRNQVTNVSIIQDATYPYEPVKSNRRRNAALVFFAALFGSVGLAILMEYADQTFKTKEEVEKHLGLAVLATVSQEEYKSCT